jgi:NADH-quinone oxidoreductase subunit K
MTFELLAAVQNVLQQAPGAAQAAQAAAPAAAPAVPLSWFLMLSAVIFTIGAGGVFLRRNIICILLCIELMLNSANLTFVAFSSYFGEVTGQLFVFVVMTVAAAEAAVGLAIVIAIFRNRETLNVDQANLLKL